MSGWRKITYEGTEYRWRFGQTYVIVRKGRVVFARASPGEITGRTFAIFERGQWKRTSDGMVKPGQVLGLIRRTVRGDTRTLPKLPREIVRSVIKSGGCTK